MDKPIFISQSEPLSWSPHAPPLTFRVAEGGWKMGDEFQMRHLRATTEEGASTRVARNNAGKIYYLPHWPAITAFQDATTPSELEKAAKALAKLPIDTVAPEIGMSSPLCFHLVMSQSKGEDKKTLKQSIGHESAVCAYLDQLPKSTHLAARQLRFQGWGLLDIALRSHQFRVAETLWKQKHRFDATLAQKGVPAWALATGLFTDVANMESHANAWDLPPMRRFLQRVTHEEKISDLDRLLKKESAAAGTHRRPGDHHFSGGIVALTHRWLGRMMEDGVDFNATVTVLPVPGPGVDETQKAYRTPFMQSLITPAVQHQEMSEILAMVWMKAMKEADYDFAARVVDPFIPGANESASVVEYARTLRVSDRLLNELAQARMTQHLVEPQSTKPKPRL